MGQPLPSALTHSRPSPAQLHIPVDREHSLRPLLHHHAQHAICCSRNLTLLIIGHRMDPPTLNFRSAILTDIESSFTSNLVPLPKDSRIIIRHASSVAAVD